MGVYSRFSGEQIFRQYPSHRFLLLNLLNTIFLATTIILMTDGEARAAVQITIDKSTQRMSVAVNGSQLYTWPVSSGIPAHETPNGTFKAFRMEEDHYSKEWDDAPMPHSIFFTKIGHAIHGTDFARKLGSPASHGCVRLSRGNAATLYALVQKEGVLNTTVTLTGSSQIALARGTRDGQAVARSETTDDPILFAPPGYVAQSPGQGLMDGLDNTAATYVDQYGRPLPRTSGYSSYAAQRRIYRTRPQYYEADTYSRQYYEPPIQLRPQSYYYNR